MARDEREIIKNGLETYLAIIAERDQLRAEVAMLNAELSEKRARVAHLDHELTEEREISARLRNSAGALIEWLGEGQSILHDVAALATPIALPKEAQIMRSAILRDMGDNLNGAARTDKPGLEDFSRAWGGKEVAHADQ